MTTKQFALEHMKNKLESVTGWKCRIVGEYLSFIGPKELLKTMYSCLSDILIIGSWKSVFDEEGQQIIVRSKQFINE